jgi:tetratricopeptide (TPR) repeat protein
VRGLCLREIKSYTEAEDAIKRSLNIHEKGKYLEKAGYDWYLIASIRSLSGNTSGALEALESALEFDRRVENSWGLAADWRAMGVVYKKSGKTQEARESYLHAIEIFNALQNKDEVEETEKRMDM